MRFCAVVETSRGTVSHTAYKFKIKLPIMASINADGAPFAIEEGGNGFKEVARQVLGDLLEFKLKAVTARSSSS